MNDFPSATLKAQLMTLAANEPAPTRKATSTVRWALFGVAAALLAFGFVALGGIHWLGRPRAFVVGTGAGFASLALLVTWFVLRRRQSMMPPALWTTWAIGVFVPVVMLGWSVAFNALFPETFRPCAGRVGFVCLDLSLTLGAVPLLLLALAIRRSAPLRPVQRGMMLGAVVGAWTAVTLQLSCECTNPSHVALGHVGPMVILSVAGGLVARVMLRPRNVLPPG